MVDVTAESVLGTNDPAPGAQQGRRLQGKVLRVRKKYNGDLKRACKRYKMLPKLKKLVRRAEEILAAKVPESVQQRLY